MDEDDDDNGDLNFRISHEVTPGTYYIRVMGFDDTETGDYSLRVVFATVDYDLTVSALTVNDNSVSASVAADQSITIVATVRNTGSTAAPPSSLHYYRSSNSAHLGIRPPSG